MGMWSGRAGLIKRDKGGRRVEQRAEFSKSRFKESIQGGGAQGVARKETRMGDQRGLSLTRGGEGGKHSDRGKREVQGTRKKRTGLLRKKSSAVRRKKKGKKTTTREEKEIGLDNKKKFSIRKKKVKFSGREKKKKCREGEKRSFTGRGGDSTGKNFFPTRKRGR